jgi:pilus assembly protein Flp/PilA
MKSLIAVLGRARRDETGATAVEYGIMVALIAVVIIGAVVILGQNLSESLDCAATTVGGLPTIDPCAQ